MSANSDLVHWIHLGTWIASTTIIFLLWTMGCVIALRRRPTPGATLFSIGFGLLAFAGLMTELLTAGQLLLCAGVLDTDIPRNIFAVQIGFLILLLLLRVFGVALVVVGAIRVLRFTERP